MAQDLYMVGLTVKDMGKSLDFYRALGVALQEGADDSPHIEAKMAGGLTFFLDTRPVKRVDTEDPQRAEALGDYKVLLEFFLPSREAVDAKYHELIELGHRSYRAPFETSFGMYFALVDDPDGNTVLLSAS